MLAYSTLICTIMKVLQLRFTETIHGESFMVKLKHSFVVE